MRIKKEIIYPDDFFCFKDGVKISEEEINEWIKEGLHEVIDNRKGSWSIASGDTEVTVEEHDEGEMITISVTNERSEFTFEKKDIIKEKKKND